MEERLGEQVEEQAILGGGTDLLSRLTGGLSIRGKILVGFLVILAMTLLVALVALIGLGVSGRKLDRMLNVQSKLVGLSLEAQTQVDWMAREEDTCRHIYAAGEPQKAKAVHIPRFKTAFTEAQNTLNQMSQLAEEEQKNLNAKALAAVNSYAQDFFATIDALDQKFAQDSGLLDKLQASLKQMEKNVKAGGIPADVVYQFHRFVESYYLYLLKSDSGHAQDVQEEAATFLRTAAAVQQGVFKKQVAQFIQDFEALQKANKVIDTQFEALDQAITQTNPALKAVMDGAMAKQTNIGRQLQSSRSFMTFAIVFATLVAVLLGVFLAWIISRGLTNQIDKIMTLLGELGIGNFDARTEVVTQDELGIMASSLNAMLDNMTTMIQSQDDQEKLQESFMKLMLEIDELTEGDLTVRAEVTEDVTGALADSVNTMAEQFGGIVRQVKGASNAVDKTAADVSALTSELAVHSMEQSQQVNETIAAIHGIAESIRQVAKNAAQSAQVSQISQANARAGAEAVEQTHRAMDEIRDQINETARSIKRLGESSMEIGNVVEIINNIADRTSILALNASIQAAMAGEAGHGFAVVAEEVQRLAESSSNSTKQIDTLIKSIQAEIKDAGKRMDESISKVVQGSQLSDGAYVKLQEIETVSNQLAELIQSISQSAADQEEKSVVIVESMVAVGEVSTKTANSTQETNRLMSVLNNTASELRAAVDVFKIEAV